MSTPVKVVLVQDCEGGTELELGPFNQGILMRASTRGLCRLGIYDTALGVDAPPIAEYVIGAGWVCDQTPRFYEHAFIQAVPPTDKVMSLPADDREERDINFIKRASGISNQASINAVLHVARERGWIK